MKRIKLTQEIQAVLPEFKKGDVVVYFDDNYGEKGIIARLGDDGFFNYSSLSKINFADEFQFGGTFGDKAKFLHEPSLNEIKQLELEEMRNGRKWNGDGYDDWLTADGLTWNELLEHDENDIERSYSGHWTSCRTTKEQLNDEARVCYGLSRINLYRLKPEESFVNVAIEWKLGLGSTPMCRMPNNKGSLQITSAPVGKTVDGWVLSGYKHEGSTVHIQDIPVLFNEDRTKIVSKATHAIFVKVN